MSINLYDLLDVAPDASTEEIRSAWRSAVADLYPNDRRFAVYNEAASVLLDPQRRAEYDAGLAAEVADEDASAPPADDAAGDTAVLDERAAPVGEVDPTADPVAEDESATTTDAAPAAGTGTAGAAAAKRSRAERRIERQAARKARRDTLATAGTGASTGASTGGATTRAAAGEAGPQRGKAPGRLRAVPAWALAALSVVLVALLAAAVYVAVALPSEDDVEAATSEAQSAAERAIVPVLSYDYRSLEADGEAAREWMTDDYQEKYDQLFAQIEESAPETKTVVRTEVVASGLVRSGEERVQVLVFVDRPTRNKALDQPVVYKDQVRMTMEKVGDRWLVDQLCTTASCES